MALIIGLVLNMLGVFSLGFRWAEILASLVGFRVVLAFVDDLAKEKFSRKQFAALTLGVCLSSALFFLGLAKLVNHSGG